MNKNIGLILFLIICSFCKAQNEANIWYFGENAGLDFNSGAPVALTNGALSTNEGCAIISDASGGLLFYTDGTTVYNANHTVMLNGNGLNGDPSSTHSAIIIPRPNTTNFYYIFTVDKRADPNGLQYSEVDMSLDGGLGAITANKNIMLETPTTEKVTAVKKTNSNEYWVVSHKWNSNEFVSYSVTSTGINTTPVVSAVGTFLSGGTTKTIGQIKISPDGTKLAVARGEGLSEVQLFDFNTATGIVSNPITILDLTGSAFVYGVEFSPNSRLLYTTVYNIGVYQFNLEAGTTSDIINSQLQLAPSGQYYGGMQLAVDGKIYVAVELETFVDSIENPNVVGLGCNYQSSAVSLDGRECAQSLPTFIQSYFNIAFQTNNVCFGENTEFTANIPAVYDSILWDFGDGNTSTIENPMHSYLSPGDYNASLTVTVAGNSSIDTRVVTIFEQPTATAIQDQVFCDFDQDGMETIDLSVYTSTILNGQNPTDFNVTYYDGVANYNNNIPLNPPQFDLLTLGNADPIASVRNVNNPDCEAITTIHVSVLEGANPNLNVPPLEFCDNTSFGTDNDGIILFDLTQNEGVILNGQSNTDFSVSYYTDAVLSNQITNPTAYQNTNTTETIYVQVSNVSNSNCSTQTNFNIKVLALPTVNPMVQLAQCDDDLDGFSLFNLNEVSNEITTNTANETITFHETQLEADNNTNSITNITAYVNQLVSFDMIWARVENTNGCHRTTQVNLLVSTTQIPLTLTRDFYECDDGINKYDGVATFNFSSIDTEIQALFPIGQQLIINYYKNQADALAENDPILDISNYSNIGYPNTQDIFIRVDSAVSNDCLGLGQHITLHVEEVPTATGPIIIEQCDIDNDGTEEIDTSNINADLLQGQTDVDIVFTDANGVVLSNPLPNPLITATQSITVIMTNTNSIDPDGACSVWTTIDIVIDPGVVANAVPDLNVCDDNDDGQFAFDTSTIEATILNGQTGTMVSYIDENGNVLSSPLPNPFITSTQTVTATVINPANPLCFAETNINFVVNDQPVANPVQDDFVCDDVSNDGEHLFNLLVYNTEVLNGQSSTLFNITYHNSQADAETNNNPLPDAYLSAVTSQIIYVRIENSSNTSCYDTTSFQIGVSYSPIAYQPSDINICDDESNDGFESFNLSQVNDNILNGQPSSDNIISYYLSQDDANNAVNAVNSTFTNTENPQTIFVRLENNSNTNCFSTAQFSIMVNEQPILNMEEFWTICEEDSIEVEADTGYDNYLWSTGETTRIITVFDSGTYIVTASNSYGSLTCDVTKTITVVESNVATITNVETMDWSQNNNSISVEVQGSGDYEYSLNGFTYQDSNEFNNLIIDDYIIYVKDKNGCGITTDDVYLLFYPSYFTPNGDNINDTWQIYNADKEPNNVISIFNRYGKLITQLKPSSQGWDGTLNGNRLPTSDYWFVLNRQNGKQYKGHFTLKR